jgi:catechol 2,3-dioxygenase-like lactoylglutathione lyase family enzyme
MIDHVALYVSDLNQSRRFYEQALEPLGYGIVFEMEGLVAFEARGPNAVRGAQR